MAHYQRPQFIHVDVRDSRNQRFDNFTSLKLNWKIEYSKCLQLSSGQGKLESIETMFSSHENALGVLADEDYRAEVELVRNALTTMSEAGEGSKSARGDRRLSAVNTTGLIRINQVSDQHILVSTLANGLANLNIFDLCIPPRMPFLPYTKPTKAYPIAWSPSATSKIEIAGINSVIVSNENDEWRR